jgi:hypothetical protein
MSTSQTENENEDFLSMPVERHQDTKTEKRKSIYRVLVLISSIILLTTGFLSVPVLIYLTKVEFPYIYIFPALSIITSIFGFIGVTKYEKIIYAVYNFVLTQSTLSVWFLWLLSGHLFLFLDFGTLLGIFSIQLVAIKEEHSKQLQCLFMHFCLFL